MLRGAWSFLEAPPLCVVGPAVAEGDAGDSPVLTWELVAAVSLASFCLGLAALPALEVIGGLRIVWRRSLALVEHHDVLVRPRHLAALK